MSIKLLLLHLCFGLSFFTYVLAISRCVEIVEAGLLPVIREHIGIQFFVTVINKGPDATEVEVKKIQCCEDFPGGQKYCSHFHLMPETRMMSPNTTRNFTLIHPTLYPYNRRGECLLSVQYMTSSNRSKEVRQNIAFDTSLREDNVRSGLLQQFPTSALDRPPCRSVDEDAMDDCHMVDCHVKYFGLKSFFNKGSRNCEAVHPCLPTRHRGTPDIVYDVTTNSCRNLSCVLGSLDLQHLTNVDLENECVPHGSTNTPSFINCHHGQLCNGTGECRCLPGYLKSVIPQEPGNPRTQLLHSCNVISNCWNTHRILELPPKSVLLTVLLLASIVVLYAFCTIEDAYYSTS